jgi:transposase
VEDFKTYLETTETPVHCDETGMRVEKKLHWFHVASTPLVTYLKVSQYRGSQALKEIGLLAKRVGQWVVHDCYASYFQYSWVKQALCNAHILRELNYMQERYHQPWAEDLYKLLVEIKTAKEQAQAQGRDAFSALEQEQFLVRYEACLTAGFQLNPAAAADPQAAPKRGRVKQTEPRNLLERLQTHRKAVLAFMFDFKVPFDNNQAERDLRMVKLKQKISGCFRSLDGAKVFAALRSYLSTMQKNGISIFDALYSVFQGKPRLPDFLAPEPTP